MGTQVSLYPTLAKKGLTRFRIKVFNIVFKFSVLCNKKNRIVNVKNCPEVQELIVLLDL